MIAKRAGLVLPTLPLYMYGMVYHDTAKVNVDFTADASMQPRSCLTSDYFYVDDDDNYDGDVFNDVYDDDDNYHDYGHDDDNDDGQVFNDVYDDYDYENGHEDGHAKLSWC